MESLANRLNWVEEKIPATEDKVEELPLWQQYRKSSPNHSIQDHWDTMNRLNQGAKMKTKNTESVFSEIIAENPHV